MILPGILFTLATTLGVVSCARDVSGVPYANDSTVQTYLEARGRLIATEKEQRQDHAFRSSLSPTAQQAERIVAAIRQDEIDNYWRRYGPVGQPDQERFAGMMFPKAKPYIPGTELWNIVQRMPKGALLHAHSTALVSADVIIDSLLTTEGMVMSASQSLTSDLSGLNATISFTHVNTTVWTSSSPSLYSTEYVPNSKVPITVAADTHPGGRAAFISFLKSKMTLTPEESIRHDLGVDAVWRKFQSCFGPIGAALNYEPIIRRYWESLFESLADDGVSWVELRSGGSSATLIPEGLAVANPDLDFWWEVMLDEMSKFKSTAKGRDFWGVRVIWSDIRSWNRTTLTRTMQIAIQRKLNYPELFSGYDLVAQEDLGRPLSDLAPELIWFQEQVQAHNVSLPFFFHAGETLGDGNSTDSNLFDAILFDTRRIGHGFSLYKHPKLMEEVKEKRIMVEVCPISNEVLRLASDVLHHPIPAMIAHGVPTSISNDDPSIMGQDEPGLSFDFYQAIQAYDNLGLGGLGALAENSVRWSNFEDQTPEEWVRDIDMGVDGSGIKATRMREWTSQWEQFCQWIVDEYGERVNVSQAAPHSW